MPSSAPWCPVQQEQLLPPLSPGNAHNRDSLPVWEAETPLTCASHTSLRKRDISGLEFQSVLFTCILGCRGCCRQKTWGISWKRREKCCLSHIQTVNGNVQTGELSAVHSIHHEVSKIFYMLFSTSL